MSIEGEIALRVGEGRLHQLLPKPPPTRVVRQIFLEDTVMKRMSEPWPTERDERLAGKAQALLESFVVGDVIVGRMPPSKKVNTVIALLEPGSDNVWEFRIGDPKPGARIFGRFAKPDLFVATNWVRREDLRDPVTSKDDLRKWRDEIVRCKTIWGHLFHPYPPHTGSTIYDFISNARLPI